MKKGILFLSIGVLSLVSCKKTFTCDCNATLTSGASNYKHTLHGSKKNATTECENIEYNSDQEYRLNGGSYICDLK